MKNKEKQELSRITKKTRRTYEKQRKKIKRPYHVKPTSFTYEKRYLRTTCRMYSFHYTCVMSDG